MIERTVYTVRQVAEMLEISEKTMYAIVRARQINCIYVRGQIRITAEALNRYLGGDNHE